MEMHNSWSPTWSWLNDFPDKWERAEPSPEQDEEPTQLEWLGDVEWEEPAHTVKDHQDGIEIALDNVKPPNLDKFKEEIELLASRLDLNDNVKMRINLYLPYLRPRMGDRKTTCAAVVLLVCRKAGSSISLRDVASAADLPANKIFKRMHLVRDLVE